MAHTKVLCLKLPLNFCELGLSLALGLCGARRLKAQDTVERGRDVLGAPLQGTCDMAVVGFGECNCYVFLGRCYLCRYGGCHYFSP